MVGRGEGAKPGSAINSLIRLRKFAPHWDLRLKWLLGGKNYCKLLLARDTFNVLNVPKTNQRVTVPKGLLLVSFV